MINRIITTIILIAAALTFSSCQDEPDIAKDVKTVDLYDEYHCVNKFFEDTDIFLLNESDVDFYSSNKRWYIKDLGSEASLTDALDRIGNISAVVIPGHYYHFINRNSWIMFDGEDSYCCGAKYYGVYVDSFIYDEGMNQIGVRLTYIENFVSMPGLMDEGSTIELLIKHGKGASTTYTFAKDVIVSQLFVENLNSSHIAQYLNITVTGNSITITNNSEIGGQARVYLRLKKGNVFTYIYLKVKAS